MMVDLDPTEVETLVDVLGEKPYKEVAPLIAKLNNTLEYTGRLDKSFEEISQGVSTTTLILG